MTSSPPIFNISGGLGKKFFRWFLIISLVPLTVVSIISYQAARKSLIDNTNKALTAAIELKRIHRSLLRGEGE